MSAGPALIAVGKCELRSCLSILSSSVPAHDGRNPQSPSLHPCRPDELGCAADRGTAKVDTMTPALSSWWTASLFCVVAGVVGLSVGLGNYWPSAAVGASFALVISCALQTRVERRSPVLTHPVVRSSLVGVAALLVVSSGRPGFSGVGRYLAVSLAVAPLLACGIGRGEGGQDHAREGGVTRDGAQRRDTLRGHPGRAVRSTRESRDP